MALPKKTAPPATSGVDFGSLDSALYSGGFQLPPGKYAMEHNIILHAPTSKTGERYAERLGVMLTAYPLSGGGEPFEQFLSMGTKANLSFLPNATGKGLEPVPGGPGNMPKYTNWDTYRESLYNAGLPVGIFSNDISVLDGVRVVTDLVPEPEGRKGFADQSEVKEERRGSGKSVVVIEILDDGKPWEGTGGLPTETAPKPAASVTRMPARTAPVAAKPAAAQAAAELDEETIKTAAINGITAVLEKPQYAKGVGKLILKTQAFKAIKESEGDNVAQVVQTMIFSSDDDLGALLGEMGYTLTDKGQVVQA